MPVNWGRNITLLGMQPAGLFSRINRFDSHPVPSNSGTLKLTKWVPLLHILCGKELGICNIIIICWRSKQAESVLCS